MWQILDMRVVQFNVFRSIKQRLSKWHQYINTSGRRRQSWGQSRSWENNHPPALHYWTNSSTLHGWTLAAIALNFLDPDLFFSLSFKLCFVAQNLCAVWMMINATLSRDIWHTCPTWDPQRCLALQSLWLCGTWFCPVGPGEHGGHCTSLQAQPRSGDSRSWGFNITPSFFSSRE